PQAPVFVASFGSRPPVPIPLSEVMKKVTLDWNSNYCIYTRATMSGNRRLPRDFLKGLVEADRPRPIDSLCWACPIPEEPCQWRDEGRFCTYTRHAGQSSRPDLWSTSRRVMLVAPCSRRRTAFGTFVDCDR